MHLGRHQTNGRGEAALPRIRTASTTSAISATASIIAALMLLTVVSVCGSGDGGASSEGGGGGGGAVKIKMGVVRRPDSCSTKSHVGDVLAIRASVGTAPLRHFVRLQMLVYGATFHDVARVFARCVHTFSQLTSHLAKHNFQQSSFWCHAHAQSKLHDTGEVLETHNPEEEPFVFTLGSGEVIEGLNNALIGCAESPLFFSMLRSIDCSCSKVFAIPTTRKPASL